MEENFLISAEDIDNISEEEMGELEESVQKYQDELERHSKTLEDILSEINNSDVYEKLGVEIHVTTDYYYSFETEDNEN